VAAVAIARTLAVLVWHPLSKDEDFACARPALLEVKLRKVGLAAGHPTAKGCRQGSAHAYNYQEVRERERAGSRRPSTHIPASSPTGIQGHRKAHGCSKQETLKLGGVAALHPGARSWPERSSAQGESNTTKPKNVLSDASVK
jgi:hypothetical protein